MVAWSIWLLKMMIVKSENLNSYFRYLVTADGYTKNKILLKKKDDVLK